MSKDLEDVTVFLITTGGPTYFECLDALHLQTCTFQLKEIRNVAPMSTAFQEMLDRCTTHLFVQVDEDMILRPGAIAEMTEVMRKAHRRVAFTFFPLWDKHLERTLVGVKIYNHDVVSNHPYRDTQACDIDLNKRLIEDGYVIAGHAGSGPGADTWLLDRDDPAIMGLHGTDYTPRSAFERYYDLSLKQRRTQMLPWFEPWPERFMERFRETGSEIDMMAAAGALAATSAEPQDSRGEKDFRRAATMPEYASVRSTAVQPPLGLDIYMTSKCNAACTFCMRQQSAPPSSPDFTKDMLRRVLGMFPSIRAVGIAGLGEPLCSDTFEDVVSEALKDSCYVGLSTNGLLVHEHDINWASFGHISVSVNEVSRDAYERRCGVDGLQRVSDAVAMLRSKDANAGCSFVIDRTNWRRIPAYLEWCSEADARFVSLVNRLPHHDVTDIAATERFWTTVLSEEDEDFRKSMPSFMAKARELHLNVNAWPVLVSQDHVPRLCQSPFEAIQVDGAGNIGGCRRVVGPQPEHGNLEAGAEVWTSAMYLTKLRRELAGLDDLRPECTMCFGNWRR